MGRECQYIRTARPENYGAGVVRCLGCNRDSSPRSYCSHCPARGWRVVGVTPGEAPDELQPGLAGLLRIGPSGLGSGRKRSSPSRTELARGFLCWFGRYRCAFNLSPSGSGGSTNSSTTGSAHLPLFRSLNDGGRSRRNLRAKNIIKLALQGINSFFDVRCSTQLLWCKVNCMHEGNVAKAKVKSRKGMT